MKSSVWNKIVLPVLFTIVIALGLAQGDSYIIAATSDVDINNYYIDDTQYSNEIMRLEYNYPTLIDIIDDGTNHYWIYEQEVQVNNRFRGSNGYYHIYATIPLIGTWSSTANVKNIEVLDVRNLQDLNTSFYYFSTNSSTKKLQLNIRTIQRDAYFQNSNIYGDNLTTFKIRITCLTSDVPTFTWSSTNSSVRYYNGRNLEQFIKDAIENSQSAEDLADILTIAQVDTQTLASILQELGGTNTHLTYIQEYAYEIWNILQTHLSTQAESDFADAETKIEDIVGNMDQYNPVKPNSQQIQTDAQSRYMQLQVEEQNDSIFFYLQWAYLLPILLLVFTFAILSYILYGGK